MASQYAYLLLMLDVATMTVHGAGVYSEEQPTTMPGYVYLRLFKTFDARGYHYASRVARLAYVQNYPELARRRPLRDEGGPSYPITGAR